MTPNPVSSKLSIMSDEKNLPKSDPSDEGIKSLLTHSLQISSWGEFKVNYNSDNYLIIEPEMDLIEACLFIIKDNTEQIQNMINQGKIRRVPIENLEQLSHQTQIKFLLVQPYTVFQLFQGA